MARKPYPKGLMGSTTLRQAARKLLYDLQHEKMTVAQRLRLWILFDHIRQDLRKVGGVPEEASNLEQMVEMAKRGPGRPRKTVDSTPKGEGVPTPECLAKGYVKPSEITVPVPDALR